MNIYYGTKEHCIDVTNICYTKLLNNNIITIEQNDFTRSSIFTDPCVNFLKKIFIKDNQQNIYEYDDTCVIQIDIITNEINTINTISSLDNNTISSLDNNTISIYHSKLKYIHNELKIKHGNLIDELPEQCMVVNYLTGYEKVLEIGSNIGRNSLVISYILNKKNNYNFVTLECDVKSVELLTENRDLNNFNFFIEPSALSKRKLIQTGWNTIESDELLDGYTAVNTITLEELYDKYNIIFDTLVLDCEGAFYYILIDMPQILNNINLIIMENDYSNIEEKNFIDEVLKKNNFYVDYVESGGWGCCYNNFFEVWRK